MITILLRIFKNLRMSHQAILINFIFLSFTVLLIYATSLVQSAIFFNYVQSFSQTLSQQQEQNLVKIVSVQLKSYIQSKNQIGILNLEHFNYLFTSTFSKLANQNSSDSIQILRNQFQDCVEQSKINSFFIQYNSDIICQILANYEYNEQEKLTIHALNFMIQYTQLFNANEDQRISYMDMPDAQIYASFPNGFKYKHFYPQSRPWYKNHMYQMSVNPNSDFFYSPIFVSVRNNLPYTTLTFSVKLNNSLIGISSQILPISDQNIQNIPLNLILTNNDGQVISSTMKSIITLNNSLAIYNETYTGFNKTDWQQINSALNTSQNGEALIYLENKIFQKEIYAYAYYFKQENITLIVFKNVTFENEFSNQLDVLIQALKDTIIQQVEIQLGCCISLILITAKIINLIFKPLLKLIKVINLHIKKMGNNLDTEIFKMFYKRKKHTDIFSSLTYQFMALKDIQTKSQQKKNRLCQEIEDITYNFSYEEKDCKKIIDAVRLIPSFNNAFVPKFIRFEFFRRNIYQRSKSIEFYTEDQVKIILFLKQVLQTIFKKSQIE